MTKPRPSWRDLMQIKFQPVGLDESDCFDCGLSQEDARDEMRRIERSLISEDAVADALEFMDEYGEVFKELAAGPQA
jgi:hypothetical protein